ncbi:hypothetical protein [Flavitalea sp.]|nr:hypothetical protein [Flavitalea sp.]
MLVNKESKPALRAPVRTEELLKLIRAKKPIPHVRDITKGINYGTQPPQRHYPAPNGAKKRPDSMSAFNHQIIAGIIF